MASSSNPFAFDNMTTMDDFDAYFDFSQGEFHPSPTTARATLGKLDQSGINPTVDPQSMLRFPQQQQQQQQQQQPEFSQYNGPSHEYGRFKQQTGFPAGAISNVTALNEMNPAGFAYNSGLDFGSDFGEGSSSNVFVPDSFDDFVDPSSVDAPTPAPTRLFPGSHSQQAQQREQLMNKRRMSSIAEDSDSPAPANDSQSSKHAKDFDDVDDDERLLNSEEGKKLSSKERRQLRNKVSARAFRSRRKEYISQLESELAVKAQECTDLQTRMRQVEQQNTQLTQLTRMLLEHPAFGQVMNDMSHDPSILAPIKQEQQRQQQQRPQPQQSQQQQNENIYVGMTTVPENPLDFSMLNLGGNNSTARQNFNAFQQQSVFAVHELPQGPSAEELQSSRLSEKPCSILSDLPELRGLDGKSESALPISTPSAKPQGPVASLEHLDETDPALELYINKPTQSPVTPTMSVTEAARHLENSLNGKTPVRFKLTIANTDDEATVNEKLDKLFAPAETVFARLQAATSHLC